MIWMAYFALLLVVSVGAIYLQRRNNTTIVVNNFEAPVKVDRNDFKEQTADFLVVVFSSESCNSCSNVVDKANVLQSNAVDVCVVDFTTTNGKALHSKYEIEAVPTTVICDSNGITQESYVGQVSATDLWAALAKARGAHIQDCKS